MRMEAQKAAVGNVSIPLGARGDQTLCYRQIWREAALKVCVVCLMKVCVYRGVCMPEMAHAASMPLAEHVRWGGGAQGEKACP